MGQNANEEWAYMDCIIFNQLQLKYMVMKSSEVKVLKIQKWKTFSITGPWVQNEDQLSQVEFGVFVFVISRSYLFSSGVHWKDENMS